MNKQISFSLLLLVFAVQFFIPAQIIHQQETTITTGTAYKFKTEPIDPSDPFRGKYITLNYEINSFQTEEKHWPYHADVFVYLKTDDEGFAAVRAVSKTLLNTNEHYIIAKSYSTYNGKLNFDLPFDRFYMNENKAYDAQTSVQEAQIDPLKTCYALVFIKNGCAVLNNVYINDTPIQQFVEEYQEVIK